MIPQINRYQLNFPDPRDANEDGIVAWGGDLTPSRIIKAYQNGIFPWYNEGEPILWWSPDPRLIMELDDFKLSRSLKKSIKKFNYKFDTNFREVITNCGEIARVNQDGSSWIQSDIIEAYENLFGMGIAHSVECYDMENNLVGGLYGLSIGKVFCGESMFAHKSDASKSAYAILIKHLKKWGYQFVDCQVPTKHLKSLGAKEVAREYFLNRLEKVYSENLTHFWEIDKELSK